MSEAEFHNVVGRHVLAAHGVPGWKNAQVSTLFMRDNKTDRILQLRIEVAYSPIEDSSSV